MPDLPEEPDFISMASDFADGWPWPPGQIEVRAVNYNVPPRWRGVLPPWVVTTRTFALTAAVDLAAAGPSD